MAVTFTREGSKIPTAIGIIKIRFNDPTGITADMGANFYLEVLDQSGKVMRQIEGDLVPQLTTAQRDGLIALMQNLRAKAVAEILP